MSQTEKTERKIRIGIRSRIFVLCIALVVSAGIGFAVLGVFQLRRFQRMAAEAGKQQADVISELSEEYIMQMTSESMQELADKTATATGWDIWLVQHDTGSLAQQVQDVIEHPDKYEDRAVYPPKKENGGRLALQLMKAEDAEPTSKDMALIRKLASLEPMMREMIVNNDYYTQDLMIALPCGLSLTMDQLSDIKLDDSGNPLAFDATRTLWWKGAEETGEGYQTPPCLSEIRGATELEYGVPIYVDGELAAVVEGSMPLVMVQEDLANFSFGDTGFFIIADESGRLIYSPHDSGELQMDKSYEKSIRSSGNQKLIEVLDRAFDDEDGFEEIVIDGKDYFVAYGSETTADWILFMFVEREEVLDLTRELVAATNDITEETVEKYEKSFVSTVWIMLLVIGILLCGAILAALLFSNRLTDPIDRMTKSVGSISGDSFDFDMDRIYRTGDEIEVLAETFAELSVRTKNYIKEITEITAEKERISAELNVAAKIQAAMLPKRFPLFPDRQEFDLYATMTPAKEVGGDFYDMFFVDDDHLCLVMGDVSGKGVPAALFMVISKTMIKNRAQRGGKPSEILHDVNNSLCEGNEEHMFVTVWLGILTVSTGELVQGIAGHEYPVVRRNGEAYELIKTDNDLALGFMRNQKYKDVDLVLGSGDSLFMYTDGLTDATNSDKKRLEIGGMMNVINAHRETPPDGLLAEIKKEVYAFVKDAPQFDDLTMMIIRYNGSQEN